MLSLTNVVPGSTLKRFKFYEWKDKTKKTIYWDFVIFGFFKIVVQIKSKIVRIFLECFFYLLCSLCCLIPIFLATSFLAILKIKFKLENIVLKFWRKKIPPNKMSKNYNFIKTKFLQYLSIQICFQHSLY